MTELVGLYDVRDLCQDRFRVEQMAGIVHNVLIAHDPLFINDKIGPLRIAKQDRFRVGLHHTILLNRIPREIIQQWIGEPKLLRKRFLRSDVIHAYTQNLGIEAFVLGEVQLESQVLIGSDAAEGTYEEEKHHILLALIVGEACGLSYGAEHEEVGRLLSDVDGRGRDGQPQPAHGEQGCQQTNVFDPVPTHVRSSSGGYFVPDMSR
jgi:hypothetical protein